tara:strand:+ start:1865 stop:2350 length:486 start_codon:yes stop_codon:yes gene_type:complete
MNEKIGELMAAGIPYATAATIIGNPAAAGIGSLMLSPRMPVTELNPRRPVTDMAQAGDFFGVREPSDSMMIEQGVMPDMSQLEGLTGFERLQKMQDIGMLNPNVNIYDDSMIYNPERDEMKNRMREMDLQRFEIEEKIKMLLEAGFSLKEATRMALFGVGE